MLVKSTLSFSTPTFSTLPFSTLVDSALPRLTNSVLINLLIESISTNGPLAHSNLARVYGFANSVDFDCWSNFPLSLVGLSFYNTSINVKGYLLVGYFLLVSPRENRVFIEDYITTSYQFPVL